MNAADFFSHETNPVRLAPDEVLFKTGDAPDAMYVVLDGRLEIMVAGKVVENAVRGAIIGEMALIDHTPRSATVIARENSSLVKLDALRFQRFIQINPFFATHVMKTLVERVRRMDKVLAESRGA